MQKLSYIIFDVGGVLLDWRLSSEVVAKKLGVTHDALFDVLFDQSTDQNIGKRMTVGQLSSHDGWNEVIKKLNGTLTPQEVIDTWYSREFWFPGTLQLVTDLHNAGYPMAIMSNSWLGLTEHDKASVFPVEIGYFERIFDSSIEKLKKPDVAFFTLVERELNVKPETLLLIDDTEKNIQVAEHCGWQGFLYDPLDNGVKAAQELRTKLL